MRKKIFSRSLQRETEITTHDSDLSLEIEIKCFKLQRRRRCERIESIVCDGVDQERLNDAKCSGAGSERVLKVLQSVRI